MVVVRNGRIVILIQHVLVNQLLYCVLRQIGVDGAGAIPQKGCKMVHLPGLPGLQYHCKGRPFFRLNQMLLQSGHGQQGGDGHMVFIYAPV